MTITGIVWLPVKIGRINSIYKLFVPLRIYGEVIWDEDWLGQHRAQLKFNPAVLLVDGVEITLESVPSEPVPIVVDTHIKIPCKTIESGRGRLVMKERLESLSDNPCEQIQP